MIPAPLALPPEAVQQLLDRVVYESLVECIDFDALSRLEDMLTMEIAAICDGDCDRAIEAAKSMIEAAWAEVMHDDRRYIEFGTGDGIPCDLCEAEIAAAAEARSAGAAGVPPGRSPRHRPPHA